MPNTNLHTKLQEPGRNDVVPAAFLHRDGKFAFAVRHYESGGRWTTPGGRCEAGETVEMALRREVAEETGVTDMTVIAYLGDVAGGHGTGETVPVFICETPEEPRLTEPEKFSPWEWLPPDDVPEPFINRAALEIVKAWMKQP